MQNKESQAELARRLEEANQQVVVGAVYLHYKQKKYKVLGIALLEATNEPCVIYQALYGKRLTFLRPVANWVEMVTWQGKTLPRFALVA